MNDNAENCSDPKPLEYPVYLDERKSVYKYQQAMWTSFEKTVLTLSCSFLAFSLTILGLAHDSTDLSDLRTDTLISAWIIFALSIIAMFCALPISAIAYDHELKKLEDALSDPHALERPTPWVRVVKSLYAISASAFVVALACLITFCSLNTDVLLKGGERSHGKEEGPPRQVSQIATETASGESQEGQIAESPNQRFEGTAVPRTVQPSPQP